MARLAQSFRAAERSNNWSAPTGAAGQPRTSCARRWRASPGAGAGQDTVDARRRAGLSRTSPSWTSCSTRSRWPAGRRQRRHGVGDGGAAGPGRRGVRPLRRGAAGGHAAGGGPAARRRRLLRPAAQPAGERSATAGRRPRCGWMPTRRSSASACGTPGRVCRRRNGKIFEPFYLCGGTRDNGGAGLGLALVRQIARRHGGEARCAAIDDGRSGFVVTLPLLAA